MAERDQVGIAADECMVPEPGCSGQMQRVHRAVVQGGAGGRRAGLSAEQCQHAGEVILDDRIDSLDPAYEGLGRLDRALGLLAASAVE